MEAMTNLEARLSGPEGAALRESLIQRCLALETRLREKMNAGLARPEFMATQSAAEAACAAMAVLSERHVAGERT